MGLESGSREALEDPDEGGLLPADQVTAFSRQQDGLRQLGGCAKSKRRTTMPISTGTQSDSNRTQGDVLSEDPQLRSVELALLRRVADMARDTAAAVLDQADHANGSVSGQFDDDFARLQSPVYQQLARAAEQSLTGNLGFRRFREKR